MFFNRIGAVVVSLTLAWAMAARAQQSQTDEYSPVREEASPGVWHLMRYAGVLQQEAGLPRPTMAGVTFALYGEKEGGIPLWMETQNVQVDSQGHYSALLGETKTGGVPAELFASGKTRWLGIQMAGQFVEERVPLGSVPYGVQAGDAQTLGGRSAADYTLTAQIQQQVQEEVRRELQAAGFDVSADDSAGGRFQKQGNLVAMGPPPNVVTLAALNEKLDNILEILNEPEHVFSWVFCAAPAFHMEIAGPQTELAIEGMVGGGAGANIFGNGAWANLTGTPKGKIGFGASIGADIPKFDFCFDLGALIRNLERSGGTTPFSSGGATPLRQASLTATDGSAAINLEDPFLKKIADLSKPENYEKMLAQMLGLADKLGVDPKNLQTLLGTVANLSIDTSGGPFTAMQLKQKDLDALVAALPIPAGMRPVVENPVGFFSDQIESLLTPLTQPTHPTQGICNLSIPGLELLMDSICSQPPDPFGPMLIAINKVTDDINTTVNSVKGTVENLAQDLVIGIGGDTGGGDTGGGGCVLYTDPLNWFCFFK